MIKLASELRKCVLYVSILRTFFTKASLPREAEWAIRKQMSTSKLFSLGTTEAVMFIEACRMVGTVPGLGQWFFFTKTMCQDTRPSLTPRFLFNRYGVLPSPTLTNGHQWFDAYPNLWANALSLITWPAVQEFKICSLDMRNGRTP